MIDAGSAHRKGGEEIVGAIGEPSYSAIGTCIGYLAAKKEWILVLLQTNHQERKIEEYILY